MYGCKPKSQFVYTYTYYGGPWNGECWYILGIGQLKYLRPFGIHMYVAVIWYILPILVYCTKKNLATLDWMDNQIVAAIFVQSKDRKTLQIRQ
jgi:hypothetical protein